MDLQRRRAEDLACRVLTFKRTLKQFFYYACLKYLQTHKVSDLQETFLEDITTFFIQTVNNIDKDEALLEKIKLKPVELPLVKEKY